MSGRPNHRSLSFTQLRDNEDVWRRPPPLSILETDTVRVQTVAELTEWKKFVFCCIDLTYYSTV